MNVNTFVKLIGSLFIILGEGVTIWSELYISKFGFTKSISASFIGVFLGGALLLLGYYLAYSAFKSIWIVTVISVVSIAILEPILVWWLFKESPSTGQIIGFSFGILGILSLVIIK